MKGMEMVWNVLVCEVLVCLALASCAASCVLSILRRPLPAAVTALGVSLALLVLAAEKGMACCWSCLLPCGLLVPFAFGDIRAKRRGAARTMPPEALSLAGVMVMLLSMGTYLRLEEEALVGFQLGLFSFSWGNLLQGIALAALVCFLFDWWGASRLNNVPVIYVCIVLFVAAAVVQNAILPKLGWQRWITSSREVSWLCVPLVVVIFAWFASLKDKCVGTFHTFLALLICLCVVSAVRGSGSAVFVVTAVIAVTILTGRGSRTLRRTLGMGLILVLILEVLEGKGTDRLAEWASFLSQGPRAKLDYSGGFTYEVGRFRNVLSSSPLVGGGAISYEASLVPSRTRGFVLAEVSSVFGLLGMVAVTLCVITLSVVGLRIIRHPGGIVDTPREASLDRGLGLAALTAIVTPMGLSIVGCLGLFPAAPDFPLLSSDSLDVYQALVAGVILVRSCYVALAVCVRPQAPRKRDVLLDRLQKR